MNKLVLIGNGFDLAHGLRTKYNDFILWYFNNAFRILIEKDKYSDQLFDISFTFGRIMQFSHEITSISQVFNLIKDHENDINYIFKCELFKNLCSKTKDLNWVDIESEYYSYLKSLYRELESTDFQTYGSIGKQVTSLNSDFEFIKVKLMEYLNTIESLKKSTIKDISMHFKNHFSEVHNVGEQLLFLNFNYTSTIEMYIKYLKHDQYMINYIHGKLNDETNHLIFGYGDEIDDYYQKIENLNNNEYLRNFKSFGYFKTNNYQNFSRFIESNPYKVYIMGHSCGLSDRTLLNTIVENDKCYEIEIFYYSKNDKENDYIEKTQELSRHFSGKTKHFMRTKIKPYPESSPLVSYK